MGRLTVRIVLFYLMIAFSIASLITGLILYFWPHGPRAGRLEFMGLMKQEWSDIHAYLSLILIPIIAAHLLENRRCVMLYVETTLGKEYLD